ncbi:MAG: ABC transporter permease subunit [Alphaproteobacteria bacterium]
MLRTTTIRALILAVTFLGVTTFAFSIIHLIPGDPVMLMAGERGLNPERHAEMMARYGFDRPLVEQYFRFIGLVLQGDLGTSIKTRQPVLSEFFELFPATVELSVFAIGLAVVVGIPIGVLAAVRRGSFLDHTTMGAALTGYSMPIFWWALLLMWLFSVTWGLTPVSSRIDVLYWVEPVTGFLLIDSLLAGDTDAFWSAAHHLVLPSIVLGTIPLAVIARMTRSSMLEVLNEDYVRTARAKGLGPGRVVGLHALRNALIPVVTVIGLQVSVLLTGAILTETIFAWPGIGKWMVEAIGRRDYPVVQGGILLIAVTVILVNLAVDILYGVINPRVRRS